MKKSSTFLKNIFRSQVGATLVEVMIAGGLAATVSLAVMRINNIGERSLNKTKADAELRTFIDDVIRRNLSDPKKCKTIMNTMIQDHFVSDGSKDLISGAQEIPNIVINPAANPANSTRIRREDDTPADTRYPFPVIGVSKGQSWKVTEIELLPFVPRDSVLTGVGVCPLRIYFQRADSFAASSGLSGIGKRVDLDIYCNTTNSAIPAPADHSVYNCVLGSTANEGLWSQVYEDGRVAINFQDSPIGHVAIGYNGPDPRSIERGQPQTPLQINTSLQAGNVTATEWGLPNRSFQGINIQKNFPPGATTNLKDGVYSWKKGAWGISEVDNLSGGAGTCLSYLAATFPYDSTSLIPQVSICEDFSSFTSGIRLGFISPPNATTYAEPSSLVVENGTLTIGGRRSYPERASFLNTVSHTNSLVVGVNNYLSDISGTGGSSFINGFGNSNYAGLISTVIGRQNNIIEENFDFGYTFVPSLDDLNFVFGRENYGAMSHIVTIGRNNDNRYPSGKIIGVENVAQLSSLTAADAAQTSPQNHIPISVNIIGKKNQVTTAKRAFVFGRNNSREANGLSIGISTFAQAGHDNSTLVANDYMDTDPSLYFPSDAPDETAFFSSGKFRFMDSNGLAGANENLITSVLIEESGAFNHGYPDKNFRGESDTAWNNRSITSAQQETEKHDSVILASSDTDIYAGRSGAVACFQCSILFPYNSGGSWEDNPNLMIAGSIKSRVFAKRHSAIFSSFNSEMMTFTSTLTGKEPSVESANVIIGGTSNYLRGRTVNTVILGGDNINITSSDAGGSGITGSVYNLGGSNHRIDAYDLTLSRSGFIGGEGNYFFNSSTVAADGSNFVGSVDSQMSTNWLSQIIAGSSHQIINALHAIILGGYDHTIINSYIPPTGNPEFANFMIGGAGNTVRGNAHNNKFIASNVKLDTVTVPPASSNGNMFITDYSHPSDSNNANREIVRDNISNQMVMRFANGYIFTARDSVNNNPDSFDCALFFGRGGTATTTTITSASPMWSTCSSRTKKNNFSLIDGEDFIEKLAKFNVQRWSYKVDLATSYIGPYAEDFFNAFKVGPYNDAIEDLDLAGINFSAAKYLALSLEENTKKIEFSKTRISLISKIMKKIESIVTQIERMFSSQERELASLEELITDKAKNEVKEGRNE